MLSQDAVRDVHRRERAGREALQCGLRGQQGGEVRRVREAAGGGSGQGQRGCGQ